MRQKCALTLALKVCWDNDDQIVVGNEFQHLGPLDAKVLILTDRCAVIVHSLWSLLLRVW